MLDHFSTNVLLAFKVTLDVPIWLVIGLMAPLWKPAPEIPVDLMLSSFLFLIQI